MRTEITIFGRTIFANELLGYFLTAELPDCCVKRLERLNGFHHRLDSGAVQQVLLLCDGKSFSSDYFFEQLKILDASCACRTSSLFYNLERNLGLEVELIKRGAQGVVFTDDQPETLLNAINKVLHGQLWASRQALGECLRCNSSPFAVTTDGPLKKLTPRECQILGLIGDGSSNEIIAAQLCISRHTVKTHLYNIFRKIDVSNRMMAARWAERYLPNA